MKIIHTKSFYFLAILIPSMIISLIISIILNNISLQKLNKEAHHQVDTEARYILSYLLNAERTSTNISSFLQSFPEGSDEQKTVIKTAYIKNDFITDLYLISDDGLIIFSSNEEYIGYNISHSERFQKMFSSKQKFIRAVKGKTGNDLNNEDTIALGTPLYYDSDTPKNFLIVTCNYKNIITDEIKDLLCTDRFLVTGENNDIIYGNAAILKAENAISCQSRIDKSLTYYYEKPTLSLKIKVLTYIVSFFISTMIFHILYFLLRFYSSKQLLHAEKQLMKYKQLQQIRQFAASTAHEIRNPLTSIKGFVTLLKSKYAEEKEYFLIIEKELSIIEEITSDFLLLGKPIENENEIININNYIKELLPLFTCETANKKIDIQFYIENESLQIMGSKKHLSQILFNVIKNAIDASTEESFITISITSINTCFIKIEVLDNGSGIPNSIINDIFTPFYTTKEKGTGLGLIICKNIIESYDGTIDIQSKENEGTKVSIVLPMLQQKKS